MSTNLLETCRGFK